jgi:hypothetical protein
VLGLGGFEESSETAARVTVPVEFLVQWDDELVPRAQSLALFDAFASAEKTLHANPGRHGELPSFETDSSLRFFAWHLGLYRREPWPGRRSPRRRSPRQLPRQEQLRSRSFAGARGEWKIWSAGSKHH